ncbi:hypothetical protein C0Q70_20985 [Pomacea canaliculata]|uniref:Uncharacterized protein n=1 Tax=Pomacea canaliculata TaxID=400727 RepID=A0A2T7NB87_POMCA|nr:hypothetical protein C0Q70_20985 [Pomacea canaliculata]
MEPVSDSLVTCLTKLDITVLSHLPDDVIRHPKVLGQLVQWPSPQGILTVLSHISENQSMQSAAVLSFNQASTDEDRASLIKLLDDCRDIVLNINLQKLLQQLNLFSCLPDHTVTSISCVNAVAPDHLPPVPVPRRMLLCQESRDRRVALQLGGQIESLQDISREILLKMHPDREEYLLEQKQQFMRFFMDELLSDRSLCQLARSIKFLTTSSNQLKAVEDLYNPCHKLLKEVLADDSFPQGEDDFIDMLQKLGLKDENQVTSEEFLQIAESLNASNDHPDSIRRAQSLWTLLTSQISRLDSRTLHELSQFRCLPALHAKSMPDSYPCDLPAAFPEAVLVSPQDVYPYQYLALVGSVAPVADERLSSHELIQKLFKQEVPVETVLKHLANITKFYNTHNSFKFRAQLNSVYSYFDKNKENEILVKALSESPCLLVENEAVFLKPASFWIEDNIDDVVLRPYRYRMSQEMTMWQTLFVACGTRIRQDSGLLLEVLSEIQAKHLRKSSQREINRDLKLVVQILETLKDYPPEERRDIILPIAHRERQVLRFRPAVECTVGDIKWLMEAESQCSGDEEVVFVHPKVPVGTALALVL